MENKQLEMIENNKKILELKDNQIEENKIMLLLKDQEMENNKKILELKDQEIQNNKKLLEETLTTLQIKDNEINSLKNLKYEEINKDEFVYIFSTDKPNIYKCGKSKKPSQRKDSLQTGNVDDIFTFDTYPTSNNDLLEKIIHNVLDSYRCKSGREHFFCNWKYIQLITHIAGCFLDTLKSTYESISKDELLNIIQNKLSNISFNHENSLNNQFDNTSINNTTSNNYLSVQNSENELPIIATFLQNYIDNNKDSTIEYITITASKLFFLFNEYIKNNKIKIDYTATKFGLDIKNYDGIDKKRTTHGFDINISFITLKKFLFNKYNLEFI